MTKNNYGFGRAIAAVFAVICLFGCVFAAQGGETECNGNGQANGNQVCQSTWEEVYTYSDDYSEGGITYLDEKQGLIEVTRCYASRNLFNAMFIGRLRITDTRGTYDWYGARVAIANPDNVQERYELRLYPNTDKLQVNYVDRTERTGNYVFDEARNVYVSEVITSTECRIDSDMWYHVLIMRKGSGWKALLIGSGQPTCFVEWKDDRIEGKDMVIGIQSAGKYVVSQFKKLIAV